MLLKNDTQTAQYPLIGIYLKPLGASYYDLSYIPELRGYLNPLNPKPYTSLKGTLKGSIFLNSRGVGLSGNGPGPWAFWGSRVLVSVGGLGFRP